MFFKQNQDSQGQFIIEGAFPFSDLYGRRLSILEKSYRNVHKVHSLPDLAYHHQQRYPYHKARIRMASRLVMTFFFSK